MSDGAVAKATGRPWAEWIDALEAAGAYAWSHRDIARHLVDEHEGVSFWWAQTVTIAYERIRGLRDVGQRRGGSYDANKSRTFAVDVRTLYRAFRDVRQRRQWLPEGITEVRTATVDKSIRAEWHDGTRVNFYFTDKGAKKSSVSLQHSGLASRGDVERVKAEWQARLNALRELLE